MGSDSGNASVSGSGRGSVKGRSTGADPSSHRLQMGTLKEEEIEFLRNSKELRDAMVAVEDLNFGEEPAQLKYMTNMIAFSIRRLNMIYFTTKSS